MAGPLHGLRVCDLTRVLTERGVPRGPVNTLDQVFADPQVRHREMRVALLDLSPAEIERLRESGAI